MMAASAEAQRVISLRLLKIARGGPQAGAEMTRMVAEKALASTEAVATMMAGGSPEQVLRRYRTIMRANEKRLRNSG